MAWWNYSGMNGLRSFENKQVSNLEYEEIKNRMVPTHTTKQSVMMILAGVFFAITLSVFETAMKNPDLSQFLTLVFRVGFFGSLLGLFLIPYGLSKLIRSVFKN